MRLEAQIAICKRIIAGVLQRLNRQEVAFGLGHLSLDIQKCRVHPVACKCLPRCTLALRNLIRVMHRDVIITTTVNIKCLAEVLHRHRRTLNMPSGIANTPRGIPLHDVGWLVGKPENKVLRAALTRIHKDILARTVLLILKLNACQLAVLVILGCIKVQTFICQVGVSAALQLEVERNHFLNVLGCAR